MNADLLKTPSRDNLFAHSNRVEIQRHGQALISHGHWARERPSDYVALPMWIAFMEQALKGMSERASPPSVDWLTARSNPSIDLEQVPDEHI